MVLGYEYTKDRLVSTDFVVDKNNLIVGSQNTLVVNVAPNIYGKQEQEDVNRLMEIADKLGIRRKWQGE